MIKKPTLVYITELFPYPPTSGGRIKSLHTIQTLSQKFNIALICFNQSPISPENLLEVRRIVKHLKVFFLPNLDQPPQSDLPRLITNYLHSIPYFVFQFHSPLAAHYLQCLIAKLKPAVIHIDHTSLIQYLPREKKQIWVLEEHNVEHQLAWNRFATYPEFRKTKLFFLIEFLFTYWYERQHLPKFDQIFTISDFDRKLLKKRFMLKNLVTQKINYEPRPKTRRFPSRRQLILFVGDNTWVPNQLALIWFVEKVWPRILAVEPTTKFVIAGKITPQFASQIKTSPQVLIGDHWPNLDRLFQNAKLFVLPFQAGGGVRIKALTAMSYRIPIVSTVLGIQGLEGVANQDYLVASSPEKFAQACLQLLRNRKLNQKIGYSGYRYLLKNHSKDNQSKFLADYQKLIPKSP